MSSNIFQISAELENIFQEIEDNGGELTPELEEQLAIKKEELDIKLDSYRRAHSYLLVQADACKKEETRIAGIRKSKEKQCDKLKGIMLDAVLAYGDVGKSGNRVVNLVDSKLYTKESKCTEINTSLALTLKDMFLDCYFTAWQQDTLDANYWNVSLDEILKDINTKFEKQFPEEAATMKEAFGSLFTMEDLWACNIKFEVTLPLAELNDKGRLDILSTYFNHIGCVSASLDVNKTEIGAKLKGGEALTVAKLVSNNSLVIK